MTEHDSRFARVAWPEPERANDERNPPARGEAVEDAPLPKLVPLERVKGLVREWTAKDWIPKRTPTLIQGDGGFGKSTLLQQLQSSCATELPWLGVLVEECPSLGVYTEDEAKDVNIRQDAIDLAYGQDCVQTGNMHLMARAGEDNELVVFDRAGNPTLTPFYRQVREALLDYRAKLAVFDVGVDLYGGDEIKRRQVRAFMRTIGGLGRLIDGGVVVSTHVSQAGIQSDGGHSGSTDWSNAARSRVYLGRPKDDDSDPDARILTRKKSNHARIGDVIKLQWKNGVFHPDGMGGAGFLDRLAVEAKAKRVFLAILQRFNRQHRNASDTKGTSYAPALFEKEKDAEGLHRRDFEAAMRLLFDEEKICRVNHGRPSKPAWTLEETGR